MKTIAIVSEGITDQVFLEELIFKCVEFEEEPEFVYAQPVRDATHRHTAPHGGWELVFEYCETRVLDALETNDYTVIQVDTDQGDHPNFNLDLYRDGCDRADADLVDDAISIIKEKINSEILEEHGEKIIFAICVHSLESWILLCVFNVHKKKNSFYHLQRHKGTGKFKKEISSYEKVSRKLKYKNFKKYTTDEGSLALFLSDFCEKFQGCSLVKDV